MNSQHENGRLRLKPGQFYGDVLNKYRASGLILSEFKHERARKLPKHVHELAFFNLLLDGDYVEYFGGRAEPLKPFTTIFHPSGVEHCDDIGPRGIRIFSVEMEDSWRERLRECEVQLASAIDNPVSELTWLATRLYREYRERQCCSTLAIEGLVFEMCANAARMQLPRQRHAPKWMPRLLELLHEQYRQNFRISDLAIEVGVNPIYLSRVFRRLRGQSISDFVHELRIQFALQELCKREVSLASIATSAGYADQSHFTRLFKQFTGMTPAYFRSMTLGHRSR